MPASSTLVSRVLRAALSVVVFSAIATSQARFAPLNKGNVSDPVPLLSHLFVADLDGDARLDAVMFDSGESRLRLARGIGNGSFDFTDPTSVIGSYGFLRNLTGGDLDGDGDVDLVIVDNSYATGGSRIHLLRNSGGRFTDVTRTSLPGITTDIDRAAVADFDGDGDADICGFHNSVLVELVNQGNFVFSLGNPGNGLNTISAAHRLLAADLDLDGDSDLLSFEISRTRYWRNSGNGTFVDVSSTHLFGGFPSSYLGTGPGLGDLDGDGDLDLVLTNAVGFTTSFLSAMTNDGQGRFVGGPPNVLPAVPNRDDDLAIGDFDGDSDADILLLLIDGACVLRREAGGNYTTILLPMLSTPRSCQAADVDADGTPEFLCVGRNGGPLVLTHDGQGNPRLRGGVRHSWPNPPPPYVFGRIQVFADLDGDGADERIVSSWNDLLVQQNDGTGWFGSSRALSLPYAQCRVYDIGAVDFDRDGDRDLVVVAAPPPPTSAPFLHLYRNDGVGGFGAGPIPLIAAQSVTGFYGLKSVDLDGDGDLDYLALCNGLLSAYVCGPTGTLVDATSVWFPVQPRRWGDIQLGDYDGDSDPDLFLPIGVAQPDTVIVLRNTGTTFVEDTQYDFGMLRNVNVTLGDIDGDGDDDLVTDDDNHRIFTNLHDNGVPTGSQVVEWLTYGEAWNQKTLVDIDLDGDLDLVVSNVALYLNDGTGRFTRSQIDGAEFGLRTGSGTGSPWANSMFTDLDGDRDPDLVRSNGEEVWMSMNLLQQIHTPDELRIGHPARLDIYARYGPPRAFDLAWPCVATAAARIAVPGVGTWLLDPTAMIELSPVFVPQPDSKATVTLPIPSSVALVGVEVRFQAAILQYPNRVVLTNATSDRLTR